MSNAPIANERFLREKAVTERFLEAPNDVSFTSLFNLFNPQLVAFFRARGCERALAEDLAQVVMLIAYGKAAQIRDRTLYCASLFIISCNALDCHCGKQTR